MLKKIGMLIVVLTLVMASANASAKDLPIVDVYFDDGSVLPNAKFKPQDSLGERIKVKHENEIFILDFKDLKAIEFVVEPGTKSSIANVTLKIKTKTGVVVNDRFSTADKGAKLRQSYFCHPRSFLFVNKLTGKKVIKSYEITNLKEVFYGCIFFKRETKAISSIVFKDGIEKETKKGSTHRTNVPSQGAAQKLSDLPEKATRGQGQVYPNTRALQEAGAAFALGNYKEAIALFMPLAKQGNPLAQAGLGMMYYTGKGVSQNYQEALKWYRKAAEQGYPLALFDLGVMYDKGHGVPQDNQMAIKWWTKAAEQNHLGAQYNLGLKYGKLMSVPDDLITAYKWANMAAASGHKEATRLLNMLRKRMTDTQIAEGLRLSKELIKKARVGKALVQANNPTSLEAEQKLIGELEKFAKVLNKNTPRMVGKDIRMDASTVGPGFRVNFNYTLPNHSAGEIDEVQLVQTLPPILKNYACSNMKLILQYGTDIVVVYHDKDGMLITSITIDRHDCGLRKIEP